MWIYYYASFGPGHQSNDYGFKRFHDSWDMEDIKEYLFNHIDSCGYSIVLNFWEIDMPPAKYVEDKTQEVKDRIKSLRKELKILESTTCFVPDEVEGEDPVLIRNISGCVISDLLNRLHKKGFMYGAEDISNWRYGKKKLCEPRRSKILAIMRSAKKYPSYEKQKRKKKHKIQLDDILTSNEQAVLFYFEDNPDKYISPTEIGKEVGGGSRHSSWGSPKCLKLVKHGFLKRNDKGWYKYIGK
jgi:hypothetical protein